jgi:4-alpha-glucanotransferase
MSAPRPSKPAWGIASGYIDARGRHQTTDAATIAALQRALGCEESTHSENTHNAIPAPPFMPAYQPPILQEGGRLWMLMVQLYAVRSERNWGHGDFGDLRTLIHVARDAGAAAVGLNPLHALAPGQASPYSPSSRVFLNPLYIDIEAVPGFPGIEACGLAKEIARLRATQMVDYPAVHAAKMKALRAAHTRFRERADPAKHAAFERYRAQAGEPLARFATFEALRERFGLPWQNWPKKLPELPAGETDLHAFVQWCAHAQLQACAAEAKAVGLPIGLYLDIAVGVDAGGADTWSEPKNFAMALSIGAPPDVYNPAGQDWGLVSFHPQTLIDSDFSSFRQMLHAVMQYAGAVRIDHALGLNRLFLIPRGTGAAQGAYVQLPFEAMLAVVAQESRTQKCLVIGEDLGTVPEGVSQRLNAWGIWCYRVALFERDGELFRHPEHFPPHAVVTFNTHDLPTFHGWLSGHDLRVKRGIGLDAGETDAERADAHHALAATLNGYGAGTGLSFEAVTRYLARTRSQLLAIAIDDLLQLEDQPNIPGTIDTHPNWRRRLPVDLEAISRHAGLARVADILAAEGRRAVG